METADRTDRISSCGQEPGAFWKFVAGYVPCDCFTRPDGVFPSGVKNPFEIEVDARQNLADLAEEEVDTNSISSEMSESRGGGYVHRLSQPRMSETADPNRWFIELEKASANEFWGFRWDRTGDERYPIKVAELREDGALRKLTKQYGEKGIHPNDIICSVNQRHSITDICGELSKNKIVLEMVRLDKDAYIHRKYEKKPSISHI